VIRLGALGDVVRSLPAVSAVRSAYPGAHLAWLVEAGSAGVLAGLPFLDEVIEFPRAGLRDALARADLRGLVGSAAGLVRALRRRRFDLALDFHSILRSGLLCRLSGAPVRVAYAPPFGREFAHLFATHRVRLAPAKLSRFDRNEALVRFLGAGWKPWARPLPTGAGRRRRFAAGAPVAIHPGSSEATPYKRYSASGYGRVARALARETGVPCLVTRGPGPRERALADAVVAASGGDARLAPETRNVADLAAVFAGCRLAIAGDTGPLHLASLVGTPVVQLLGPTDPVENAPWRDTPARSLRVSLPCSPCRRGCAAATCLRALPPEAVIAAARDLLSPASDAGAAVSAAGAG
jgi:ADP-heptose:LPS heptosyltransferase